MLSILLLSLSCSAEKKEEVDSSQYVKEMLGFLKEKKKDYLITIETKFGEMKAILFDKTPKHKANFVKLANDGFFDSTTFHRVIKDFMVQGGDPNSKDDDPNNDGNGGPGYQVDAEFRDDLFHVKGALSAARLGDRMNPEKKSSGSQFYVVQGKKVTRKELEQSQEGANSSLRQKVFEEIMADPAFASYREKLVQYSNSGNQAAYLEIVRQLEPEILKRAGDEYFKFPESQILAYEKIGGTPHLDRNYTVFGLVVKGLDVLDKIAEVPVGGRQGSSPKEKVIMTVTVRELKVKKILKELELDL